MAVAASVGVAAGRLLAAPALTAAVVLPASWGELSITRGRYILACEVLTLLLLVVLSGSYLRAGRQQRSRSYADDRQRSWGRSARLGGVFLVLLCQLMVGATAALAVNRSFLFVTTVDEAAHLVSGTSAPAERAEMLDPRRHLSASASEWVGVPAVAHFASAEDGLWRAELSQTRSGVNGSVWAWWPEGYGPGQEIPSDAEPASILVLLHGDPGEAPGVVRNLHVVEAIREGMRQGTVPPTIVIAPDLNVDDQQRNDPDCADIEGHAQVGTWVQEDLPLMVRATFPSASTDRGRWALGGVSAGAYCAVWTVIQRADVYGVGVSLSGYDVPLIGGLSSSPDLREQNTLSTLLQNLPHDPVRLWLVGPADDVDAHAQARHVAQAAQDRSGDEVVAVTPASGGHSWALWSEQMAQALHWWGRPADASGASPDAVPQAKAMAGTSDSAAEPSLWGPQSGLMLALSACGWILTTLLAAGCRLPGRRRPAASLRVVGLFASCVLLVSTVFIAGNSDGAFYSAWGQVWADLWPALRDGLRVSAG